MSLDGVAAYVEATNDNLGRYVDRGVAPPVYAVVSSASSHMGLLVELVSTEDLLAAVHLGHAMDFHRPVVIGETVTSRAELVETRRSPFGSSLTMKVQLLGEIGDVSSVCYHRVLFRGVKRGKTAGEAPSAPKVPRGHHTPIGEAVFHVAQDQSLRYANASGDFLPIHTSRDVARHAGFPDLILHGMCTLAMCASTVVDLAAAGDPTRLRAIGATFTRPVVVGRELRVSATRLQREVLRVTASQNGKPVIRDGYATVSVR